MELPLFHIQQFVTMAPFHFIPYQYKRRNPAHQPFSCNL